MTPSTRIMNLTLLCLGLLLTCSACASPAGVSSYPVGFPHSIANDEPASVSSSIAETDDHGWMVGPVSSGSQQGASWTFFNEFSSMDLEDESFGLSRTFNMRRTGVKFGLNAGQGSLGLVLVNADTHAEDDLGPETSRDWAVGLTGGWTFVPWERVGVGVDFTGLLGSAEYSDAFEAGELDYAQLDSRIGIAYRPSADAMLAFAPVVGVGYRVFDSEVIPDFDFEYELDGDSAYTFVGGSLAWRRGPGKLSMGLEILVMAGGVEGLVVSIPLSALLLSSEAKVQ